MGTEQSTLTEKNYVIEKEETKNAVVATKGDDKFLIKKIILHQVSEEFKLTLFILKYYYQNFKNKNKRSHKLRSIYEQNLISLFLFTVCYLHMNLLFIYHLFTHVFFIHNMDFMS